MFVTMRAKERVLVHFSLAPARLQNAIAKYNRTVAPPPRDDPSVQRLRLRILRQAGIGRRPTISFVGRSEDPLAAHGQPACGGNYVSIPVESDRFHQDGDRVKDRPPDALPGNVRIRGLKSNGDDEDKTGEVHTHGSPQADVCCEPSHAPKGQCVNLGIVRPKVAEAGSLKEELEDGPERRPSSRGSYQA